MNWKRLFDKGRLRICGYDYRLRFGAVRSGCGEMLLGETDYETQRIRVAETLPDEQTLSTILHEALHVIDHALQLELQEVGVRRLESGLHGFLKANPDVCKAYLSLHREQR